MSKALDAFDKLSVSTSKEWLRKLPPKIWPKEPFFWMSTDDVSSIPEEAKQLCQTQLAFIDKFKDNWRSNSIMLPEDWKIPKDTTIERTIASQSQAKTFLLDPRLFKLLALDNDNITYLLRDEIRQRYTDVNYFGPDFLMLATSGSSRSKSEAEELALSWYLDRLISFVEYDGEEKTAEAIVPAFFAQIPRCWLRTHPAYDFMLPEEMDIEVDEEAVDFALVLRSICSPGLRRPSRDGLLRVNLAHPAMVVGIKGPARWGSSDSPFFKYQSDTKQRDSLPRSMHDLCRAVQSSLHTHSIYWDYLQAPIDDLKTLPYPYQSRPEWLVVFGVVYDAAYIRIVAHIPYFVQNQVLKHLSFIVDSIPFTHGLDGALDRARAALALFSLRKHAFRLSNVDKLRRSEWHHRTILTQILSEEHEYLPYDNVKDPLGSNSYDSDNEDVKDGEVLEDHKIEEDGDESDDIEEDGDESDDDHYEALDMLFEGVYKAEADGGELDEGESEEGESEEGESEEEGSSEDESNEAESNEVESSEAESSEEESDEGESDPNDESKILGWDKPIEYEDKDPLHQDVNKATYQVTMNKDFRKKVKKCQDAYACKAMAEDMGKDLDEDVIALL